MKPGSPDYMRELLSLAADGRVALDGKAAAYLVWGAAKTQLRSSEPELQRVVPLVFEHIDTMRANDMSSLIWGMGLLGIKPSSEQRGQLRNGLLPLLAQDSEGAMRMKDLTATAVGVSRLGLPTDIVASLVEAFEHRITSGAPVSLGEATRLVKVLPYLPGLTPSSPLPLAVFDCLLTNAHSPGAKLHSLADMAFAAGKMGCCFNGADVERLLSCAADKLGQNRGPQVHALLHGLGLMGLRASEQGPVTNEFVSECVDSQLTTQQQPQHMARLVSAVGALRAALPEDRLQRMLEELSANGLASLPEWQEEGQQQQEEAQEQHQQQEEEEATQQQQ
ncbi:hypothetical protein C2E21_8715 [Chlorella sorokiniana]|uniref:Uncharacterized protein n=1 Tax=Chlorella sorokiniana TaxID=3076 RepID=A0A2P6TDD6_CHLSO|nr:hypothetical protein C2E21_8715 [Chlorella sorokiniana]|eukprot:PRW20656.1 hypothetical protein C2E21_8715 [Chlorella sorokiniana]